MAVINGKTYPMKETTPENSEYNSLLLRYIMDEIKIKQMQKQMKKNLKRLDEILESEKEC